MHQKKVTYSFHWLHKKMIGTKYMNITSVLSHSAFMSGISCIATDEIPNPNVKTMWIYLWFSINHIICYKIFIVMTMRSLWYSNLVWDTFYWQLLSLMSQFGYVRNGLATFSHGPWVKLYYSSIEWHRWLSSGIWRVRLSHCFRLFFSFFLFLVPNRRLLVLVPLCLESTFFSFVSSARYSSFSSRLASYNFCILSFFDVLVKGRLLFLLDLCFTV